MKLFSLRCLPSKCDLQFKNYLTILAKNRLISYWCHGGPNFYSKCWYLTHLAYLGYREIKIIESKFNFIFLNHSRKILFR